MRPSSKARYKYCFLLRKPNSRVKNVIGSARTACLCLFYTLNREENWPVDAFLWASVTKPEEAFYVDTLHMKYTVWPNLFPGIKGIVSVTVYLVNCECHLQVLCLKLQFYPVCLHLEI